MVLTDLKFGSLRIIDTTTAPLVGLLYFFKANANHCKCWPSAVSLLTRLCVMDIY